MNKLNIKKSGVKAKNTRKVIRIDTIAMLKHRHSNIEIHLKNRYFFQSPLNLFQQFMYWCLGFDYVYGIEYVHKMSKILGTEPDSCGYPGK